MQKTEALLKVLNGQPVIPVLLIDNAEDAVPLARALAAGGLPAIEITLRTKDALEAIKRVANEVENCIVGAGTILEPKQFEKAEKAGSKFIVSPGCTKDLRKAANDSDVPLLPGAITPSEVMAMFDNGYSVLKFFPAEQAGGASMLKAFSSPLSGAVFCPTGGITEKNAMDYLSLPNVVCVGGSWVAPKAAVEAGDWAAIEKLAAAASKIRVPK
jgi:2-dehydro-3-deoxyphosphogluconate aldolase / (4S)-4-hydroxy-2-oxoglutarate aldolase